MVLVVSHQIIFLAAGFIALSSHSNSAAGFQHPVHIRHQLQHDWTPAVTCPAGTLKSHAQTDSVPAREQHRQRRDNSYFYSATSPSSNSRDTRRYSDSEGSYGTLLHTGYATSVKSRCHQPMTRSRAVASIFSSALLAVGGGLGLLGCARPTMAAAPAESTTGVENSVVEATGAAVVSEAADAAAPAAAKYVVGPDEFGVLLGDGSIGIKLGDNPLKASGVCRTFVTEVCII